MKEREEEDFDFPLKKKKKTKETTKTKPKTKKAVTFDVFRAIAGGGIAEYLMTGVPEHFFPSSKKKKEKAAKSPKHSEDFYRAMVLHGIPGIEEYHATGKKLVKIYPTKSRRHKKK
ncbi:MAG: hypothetical protein ACRDF4_00495 [Rhabdochlamydiaceae bacterium]